MGSLFLSPNYKPEVVTATDIRIASLTWGFTLGFSFLTAVKAAKQTATVWRRARRLTTYLVLVWVEMLSSTVFGFLAWFFIDDMISPSFALFFVFLTLWVFQIQCLLQIIINRLGILIIDKRKHARIKWGTAAFITAVNVSVYCIWIPARLQISQEYIHINSIWDRCEKAIYLVVDGCLNAYFLYLVKSTLVSNGMTKYSLLYNFNAFIVFVSLSMDVLIIATMSLKNSFVYMQFHPIAYIVKLNIEMTMAELITKVAQTPHHAGPGSSSGPNTSGGDPTSTGISRSWYHNKKQTGHTTHDHQRLPSHAQKGHKSVEIQDGNGRRHITGVTAPVPGRGYSAWVRAGGRQSRDLESQPKRNRTHFDDGDDDDPEDGEGSAYEMKFIDFLKGDKGRNGGRRTPLEENTIIKTMETVITTGEIYEGQEAEGSGSVTPRTTDTVAENRAHSETDSTRELAKEGA